MNRINQGMIAALIVALAALDAVYRYDTADDAFRLVCAAVMAIFGGWAWISWKTWGLWLRPRRR